MKLQKVIFWFFPIANVKINVTDENDNAPRFAKQLYEAFVSEDANIGSEIITVFAKDLDEGLNGKVTYSFSRENEMFSIDKNSGVITLKSQLDREIEDHYEILGKLQCNYFFFVYTSSNNLFFLNF